MKWNKNFLLLAVLATSLSTTYTANAADSAVKLPITPSAKNPVDFTNSKAQELPTPFTIKDTQSDIINSFSSIKPVFTAKPVVVQGSVGDGKQTKAISLGKPVLTLNNVDVVSMNYGTGYQPFTTARADLSTATNTMYPYRATGKLFFTKAGQTYVCSASLIKRGVIVTAAHCVANYGAKQLYSNWQFVPGYSNGSAPFGVWTGKNVAVLNSYYTGTGPCSQAGVICQNDLAIIELNPISGTYPGTNTGWYGIGYDGYGFTPYGQTHITELGYPVTLDNGVYMERTDSYGFVSAANSNNTIIGSNMLGGSSGGPWINNFGYSPALTGATAGGSAIANVVVGVTSWGFSSGTVMQQGASPFTSSNIVPLINQICTANNPSCL